MDIIINISEQYDADVIAAIKERCGGQTPEDALRGYLYDHVVQYKLRKRQRDIEQTIRDSVADLKQAQK